MDQVSFALAADGWHATGVLGFEAFDLRGLRAALIDGEPTLIGVTFVPRPGEHRPADIALTPKRLAALPGRRLAAVLLAFHEPTSDVPAWIEAMRRLDDEPMVRPRKGSVEFSEEVADVIRVAREQGDSAVQAVADRWHVGIYRADQYIREMREHLGDRAPGDGRRDRPRRGPRSDAPVEVTLPRRRPVKTIRESVPSPASRRQRRTTPEESA
ncbi:hypothetical protein [uncultured Amnibacterium sp.]|uniref:hypothetical protein n=1 Tax=uncultured Amnibacterium sp. TaxID=1631851 RepID=UPI0035CA6B9E